MKKVERKDFSVVDLAEVTSLLQTRYESKAVIGSNTICTQLRLIRCYPLKAHFCTLKSAVRTMSVVFKLWYRKQMNPTVLFPIKSLDHGYRFHTAGRHHKNIILSTYFIVMNNNLMTSQARSTNLF